MYAQQLSDGTWKELQGNVVFSPTVYQTAESLSDEQRAQFGVVFVAEKLPPQHDADTHVAERDGIVYNDTLKQWETGWKIRPLTAEELAARVPQSVSMRQARLALLQFGLLAGVDAALAAISDDMQRQAAQIEWEYAAIVERNSALVQQLGGALGLTAQQFDQLFTLAATL